jgi:hypothetical protein
MSLLVRAFPLRSSIKDLKTFATALRTDRKAETAAFYRKFGVSHESWHVQETPSGPWVIGVTAIDNAAEAAPRYAESSAEFDNWFKQQVLQLTGVNPDQQPLGPPTTQVFVWADDQRPNSNLCA